MSRLTPSSVKSIKQLVFPSLTSRSIPDISGLFTAAIYQNTWSVFFICVKRGGACPSAGRPYLRWWSRIFVWEGILQNRIWVWGGGGTLGPLNPHLSVAIWCRVFPLGYTTMLYVWHTFSSIHHWCNTCKSTMAAGHYPKQQHGTVEV